MRESEFADEGRVLDVKAINKVRRNGKIVVCSITWNRHPAETILYVSKKENELKISKVPSCGATRVITTRSHAQTFLNLIKFKPFLEKVGYMAITKQNEDYFLRIASEEEKNELAVFTHPIGYVDANYSLLIRNSFIKDANESFSDPIYLFEKHLEDGKNKYLRVIATDSTNVNQYPNASLLQSERIYLPISLARENHIFPGNILETIEGKCETIYKLKKETCYICGDQTDPYDSISKNIAISGTTQSIIDDDIIPIVKSGKSIKESKIQLTEKEIKISNALKAINKEIKKIERELKNENGNL